MNMVGELPGYGKVRFQPTGIYNNLSLLQVKDKYKVVYERKNSHGFCV